MLIFSRYSYWVGAMLGLALLLIAFSAVGLLDPVQGVVLRVTSPIEKTVSGAFRPIATILSDAGNLDAIRDENRRLRVENEQLRVEIAELEQETERVAELEAIVAIPATQGETLVPANITQRFSSPFTDTVRIDRGSGSGIRAGMVVLSAQGSLLGTVTEATGNSAFIRLVTDSNSRVAAQVAETKVTGSAEGTADRKLAFNFAETGDEVAIGHTIVTSGLGGNYPPEILIGTVRAVSGTPQDLFRDIEIEPTIRLSTAQTVLVNISFVPQRLDLAGP